MLNKPNSCVGCCLYGNGRGFSILEGSGESGLLVIAEALGRAEELKGLPLRPDAKAGGIWQKALDSARLARERMTITNVIRCRPPDNELKGMPYERDAIDHCKQYLDQAIAARQPRLILVLGDVPLRELSLSRGTISELRGYVLQSRYGIPLIATYHPSHIARGATHLFGVFRHDIRRAENYARRGIPANLETSYCLRPDYGAVRRFLDHLRANPQLAIAYDIETDQLIGGRTGRIIQIQFSYQAGRALVVPYRDLYVDLCKEIMALSNDKWDWNGRLFDRIKLREHGFVINGECHDLMNAWGHSQPGLVSSKDENDDEKKIPSKLMRLQACMSFYYPEFGPWKGVEFPAWDWRWDGQWLPLPVRLYGAKDVDSTVRLGYALFRDLRAVGLYQGYYRFKYENAFMLDSIGACGLPVDKGEQDSLKGYIGEQEELLVGDLQKVIPREIRSVKTYKGWPKDLREAVKSAGLYVKNARVQDFMEIAASSGYEFSETGVLVKPLAFNPNSAPQMIRYIEHMGYPVPKHIDTGKPTTGKEEMDKLAEATGDPVLKLCRKQRRLTKLKGTYCSGAWVPGADGRVHGEFRFGTANQQTSCSNPNVQQFPEHFNKDDEWLAEIGRRVKSCIRAEPGHKLVKVDARGFHARMQGWLAEDADYYRLANLDLHSFNTAQFMQVPDKDVMLDRDDGPLLQRLKEIKKQYAHERNALVKRVSFLNQYGGGAEKASRILGIEIGIVQRVLDSLAAPFPKTFEDFPAAVKAALGQSVRLINAFGCCRWFWDKDMKEAIAFSVASPAHCHIQDAGIRLWQQGAFDLYEAVNFTHDAYWFHPREELVEECIVAARAEMERPSTVLVNSLGPFQVMADAQVGDRLSEMRDV